MAEIEKYCGSCGKIMSANWSHLYCPICGSTVKVNFKQKRIEEKPKPPKITKDRLRRVMKKAHKP